MQSASFPERQSRSHYRHELRTLTYVILDEANGGIIRNLNHEGVAVQAVGALRAQQRIRLRFELRFPRLRVDACGQVSWANPSGQCGIRFVDLPERTHHQINQWIFSNLLDAAGPDAAHRQPMFEALLGPMVEQENSSAEQDGLSLSANPRPAIRLEHGFIPPNEARGSAVPNENHSERSSLEALAELDWLFRPISAQTLAWFVDGLVIIAALLLFGLIFLSIAHELPQWPLTVGAIAAAAAFIASAYWSLFTIFGGRSLGARLAGATGEHDSSEEGDDADRFR
jgi:hypothetical protein